jgi:hypothetical protein
MPFAGEQARGRIEADPAGARQVHLAPGVQVGEVMVGSRRTVERFDVGHQLDQVARNEARRQPEMAQHLHQQPGGVTARAARQFEGFLGRLHAGLEADDVAHRLLHLPVEVDQKVDAGARFGGNVSEAAQQRRQRQTVQIGFEFFLLPRFVLKGKVVA